jgi:aryl carrier-like protein
MYVKNRLELIRFATVARQIDSEKRREKYSRFLKEETRTLDVEQLTDSDFDSIRILLENGRHNNPTYTLDPITE